MNEKGQFEKGGIPWNKGKKTSVETLRKLSLIRRGKHPSKEANEKNRLSNLGKKRSDETKRKQSIVRKNMYASGYVHPMKGKHRSNETKRKISEGRKRNKRGFPLKGHTVSKETRERIRASLWKGGKQLSYRRAAAKRKGRLGFEPINELFEGCEGHHIDENHIIFIPKELHRSIWHSLDKPETMDKINTKALLWVLGIWR